MSVGAGERRTQPPPRDDQGVACDADLEDARASLVRPINPGLQCIGASNLLPATIVTEDFARVGDGIVKNLRR